MEAQQTLDEQVYSLTVKFKTKQHLALALKSKEVKEFVDGVVVILENIWSMAKEDKIKNIERYLAQFSKINQLIEVYYTSNNILDQILTNKQNQARKYNINLIVIADQLFENQIDIAILVSIVINILDTAINDVQVITDTEVERVIRFKMIVNNEEGILVIDMEHPTNGRYGVDELPAGFKIAKGLVEEHGHGTFEPEHEDYYCTVHIQLPIEKQIIVDVEQQAGGESYEKI
jgi:hypothetical protein